MILPDVQLYAPHTPQDLRHDFHPLVLLVHHLRAELAYFIRDELIDRYEDDRETDTGEERQSHLIVEQIERDGDLQAEFIKLVKTAVCTNMCVFACNGMLHNA